MTITVLREKVSPALVCPKCTKTLVGSCAHTSKEGVIEVLCPSCHHTIFECEIELPEDDGGDW